MAAPPTAPVPPKSRGHSLFDRQAQLHADDPDKLPNHILTTMSDLPLSPMKPFHSGVSSPVTQRQQYSPLLVHRRSPLSSAECYTPADNNNVQLIGIHRRSELSYVNDWPIPPITAPKELEQLQETDFPYVPESEPLVQNPMPSDSLCCALVEQAFDYLQTHDDDDDVIHRKNESQRQEDPSDNVEIYDNEENSDGGDSVDTIDLDATTSTNHQNDSGIHTLSSRGNSEKRHDSDEKLTDFQSPMASSSRGTGSEDNDSDLDNQSHEDELDNDDEQVTVPPANEEAEQKKLLILRQQTILWGIEQEWLRKEKSYIEQLEQMDQQLNYIPIAVNLSALIRTLIVLHKNVCKEIEYLYERDHQPSNLTKQLTRSIEVLMQTLPHYDDYIKTNLAPIRKALEKRMSNPNALSSEDLLSIPTKQFLQILSQVQDLHKTAQSFQPGDQESLVKLYDYVQKCKFYGSRQDENINKIVLKNEDVVTTVGRGNRDRCRLILYPDAIVCCNLKTKLLTSPKYALLWFIPMIDLRWTMPQSSSDDSANTGDELKLHLKSAYKELEKSSNNVASSRLAKNIRKQENEYNLAQSKLQLILSNSRSSISCVILFSSAYQLQDWIDLMDKTKQELVQRSSTLLNPINTHHQRLTESLIQKRLDLLRPSLQEFNLHESSTMPKPSKTYSGTLHITIHSVHGPALSNPIRQQQQNNLQFYVAVEIDSYNTFYPYAQTAKQAMQQQDSVEFRGEVRDI